MQAKKKKDKHMNYFVNIINVTLATILMNEYQWIKWKDQCKTNQNIPTNVDFTYIAYTWKVPLLSVHLQDVYSDSELADCH